MIMIWYDMINVCVELFDGVFYIMIIEKLRGNDGSVHFNIHIERYNGNIDTTLWWYDKLIVPRLRGSAAIVSLIFDKIARRQIVLLKYVVFDICATNSSEVCYTSKITF